MKQFRLRDARGRSTATVVGLASVAVFGAVVTSGGLPRFGPKLAPRSRVAFRAMQHPPNHLALWTERNRTAMLNLSNEVAANRAISDRSRSRSGSCSQTGAGKAHQWRFGPRFPGRRHLTGSPPQAQPTVTFATGPTPRGGGRSHVERKIGYISGLYTRFGRSAHASARAKEGSAGTGPRRSLRYWCLCSPELWSSLAPAFTPASTPCVPKPPPTGRRFKRLWIPSGRKCCRLPNSRRGSKASRNGKPPDSDGGPVLCGYA